MSAIGDITELAPTPIMAEPKAKPTHVERVRARLQTRDDLEPLKRKNYNLRRLVAGDLSVVLPNATPADAEEIPNGDSTRELFDFIVTSIEDGHSNKLQKTIRTLVHQVSYTAPDIEFEDLDALEAAVASGYCKIKLGDAPKGCAANDEMKLALMDYLLGGMGWVKTCWKEDKPSIMFCDMLDMAWDRTAKTPARHRWRSCRFRETFGSWIDFFPKADFDPWMQNLSESGLELDTILEVEFYYDVDGDEGRGSFYAFPVDAAGAVMPEPLEATGNPYYFTEPDGATVPFLPYECLYFWLTPSLMSATGLVEQMLPNQVAVWEGEEAVRKTVLRSSKFYQVREGALKPAMIKRFERGDQGALIEYTAEGGPIQEGPNLEVPQSLLMWIQKNEAAVQEHGAANPYVGGAPQGVDFAREVEEISTQAGQMAGVIAKDYAAFWVRTMRKFLGVAALYDDRPITIRVDNAPMVFGMGMNPPISKFLYPDADIVIREDKMQFKSNAQKLQEATMDLTQTMLPAVMQAFPNAFKLAFEAYLRARGIENIQPWIQPPQMAPGQMGDPTGMGDPSLGVAMTDGQVAQ